MVEPVQKTSKGLNDPNDNFENKFSEKRFPKPAIEARTGNGTLKLLFETSSESGLETS
jgi:hypothetical protein